MSSLAGLFAGAWVLVTAGVALADRPTLHPNAIRYAERSPAATTGRAGTARVSLRALYSPSEETTEVELTTGAFEGPAAPGGAAPGTIAKLQLSLLDARGETVWSDQNRPAGSGAVSFTYGHLHPGERLQAQVQVQGAGGRRSHAVTVVGQVRRRPDVAITQLQLGPRARRDSVVNVQATVSELNGDAGARADCVLLVDGAPVDRALGIWVDAGRSVTCAFSHRFADVGEHNVQVMVDNVGPADDRPVNNDQEAAIVVFDEAPVGHAASAWSRDVHHLSRHEGSYDDGTWARRDWSYLSRADGRDEGVNVEAWTAARVTSPVSVAVWEGAPGSERRTYLRSDWSPAYRWGDDSCGGARDHDHDPTAAAWVYVFSASCDGSAWTQVDYRRYAGDVVYFSSGHQAHWTGSGASPHQYAWNRPARSAAGARLVDADAGVHRVRLHLHDGKLHAVDTQIPLRPISNDGQTPLSCRQYDYGYGLRACSEERRSESGALGMAVSGR